MLWLDFETRSRCDLKTHGVYNYSLDGSTDVLCMSYAFGDDDVRTWTPDQPFPKDVRNYKKQIRAHNAAFERLIFWHVLEIPFKLEQFYCTAAQARANCLPGSLEDIGRAISSAMKKDHRGNQLIRMLSIPRADGTFNDDPALMAEMVAYCEQDVRAMRAVSKAMRELADDELRDYHVNERINDRGVLVDRALCDAAVRYASAELEEIQQIVTEVTKGAITSVRSPKMRQWVWDRVGPEARKLMTLHKDGEEKQSIDKSVRANLLAMNDPDQVPPDVEEVIQCADDLWASSVAKFNRLAALADEEDNRVRGAFVFAGGSATGRACVAASTLIESELGRRPISALIVGEKVLTHMGKFCKVTRVVYKGRQPMFRVATRSGGWVDCTMDHKLLTNKGWKNVEELISYTRSKSAGRSDEDIYLAAVPYNGGDWTANQSNARDCFGNRARDGFCGTAKDPQSGELFQIEDGREEPYVWSTETSRSDIAARVSIPVDWRGHLFAGTSYGVDESTWVEGLAGRMGSTPYRQQQRKQQLGQSGYSDESWSRCVTWAEIAKIVCVGEKGVWDISVEGDASYCAQGMIHHNSSYGAQVHNFTRKCAKEPDEVRQAMVRGHAIVPKYGKRVTDVLKGMLRPALLPAEGKSFVVADWSSIEARVTPWLSNSPQGDAKLQLFVTGKDVYKVNASATFRVPYDEVTDEQRQIGKVQELALGFSGGIGAFAAMGRAYGIVLPESDARRMVDGWRRANPWAMTYWQSLESAYMRALRNKNHPIEVGRVTYLYDGTHLWYALPSGRVLCYPFARVEDDQVTYLKAAWKPAQDAKEWPRARLWRGLACENITQATANDLLRYALRQVDAVVLHCHDEIVTETSQPEEAAAELKRVMATPPNWAGGLPLAAEVKIMHRYGK